jgi:hypothetical protein
MLGGHRPPLQSFEIEAAQAVTEFAGAVQLVVTPCQTFADAETKLEN